MKKLALSLLVVIACASVGQAADKVNWKRIDAKAATASIGDQISVLYITGLPEIDGAHTCYTYSVRFEFGPDDLILERNMIDQKKGRGVEEVEVTRIPYAAIRELLFGYDAIYAAQEGALPTAQKVTCNDLPLKVSMQVLKSPLAILFDRDGKRISAVVAARDKDALALYQGLADRTRLKVKTPLVYKGIVKQRGQLDPPPPEGER